MTPVSHLVVAPFFGSECRRRYLELGGRGFESRHRASGVAQSVEHQAGLAPGVGTLVAAPFLLGDHGTA